MSEPARVIRLEKSERKKIEKQRHQEKDARLRDRLAALLWLDDGRSVDEVASLLDVEARTIRNWVKTFKKKGRDALTTLNYTGDPGNLTTAECEQLKQEVATGRFKSASMVRTYIQDHFQKKFSLSGTRKLLVRLGCSFHKVSSFLFKAKRDKQEAFVNDCERDKSTAQKEGWRRYFIDGVHPLYGMEVLFYCWWPASGWKWAWAADGNG